jgi:hypothetical protein
LRIIGIRKLSTAKPSNNCINLALRMRTYHGALLLVLAMVMAMLSTGND